MVDAIGTCDRSCFIEYDWEGKAMPLEVFLAFE